MKCGESDVVVLNVICFMLYELHVVFTVLMMPKDLPFKILRLSFTLSFSFTIHIFPLKPNMVQTNTTCAKSNKLVVYYSGFIVLSLTA